LKEIENFLKKDLEQCLKELRRIGNKLDSIIPYHDEHSKRVAFYALAISNSLNFSKKENVLLEITALLHDLGKVGIDGKILWKPLPLTIEERNEVQKHSLRGYYILSGFTGEIDILTGVRSHHERLDGTGYPDGLRNSEIPLFSKILAVADSFDAMTSKRPYRSVFTKKQALVEIEKCAGSQFDARTARIFLKAMGN